LGSGFQRPVSRTESPEGESDIYSYSIIRSKKQVIEALVIKKAISLGYYNAAQILGSLYLYHKDFMTEKNFLKKAEQYLKLALKNGFYESTTNLANIYINYKNDYETALTYLIMGAEHDIAATQLMLAILYNWGYVDPKSGFEIKKDPYTAQMLLTKACTNKNKTPMVDNFCKSAVNRPLSFCSAAFCRASRRNCAASCSARRRLACNVCKLSRAAW